MASILQGTTLGSVQSFAMAIYGIQLGSTTMNAVITDGAKLNNYFPAGTVASVATTMVANLGITGDAATAAVKYVTDTLNAADKSVYGDTVAAILKGFAGMTGDATFGAAATAWNAKVANAVAYVANNAADVALATAETVNAAGIMLKVGNDNLTGTSGSDTFTADFANNSNTFESGDVVNGGAGVDTLKAFLGTSSAFSITANVSNVENLVFTAQSMNATGSNSNNNMYTEQVTVDAGRMSGETRIEDTNSRADLVVEDVRIADTQITKDVTIAMVSTDPGQVDFGVYFDQPSLRAAAPTTNSSTVNVEWMDTRSAIAGGNPLKDVPYSGFNFTLNGKTITVTSAEISAAQTYDALLAAVKTAVAANAELKDFSVAFGTDFRATDTASGVSATGKTITLTNNGAGTLAPGSVLVEGNVLPSSSGLHTNATVGAPATSTAQVTATIVLDEVGRGSTGGDLVVGGLSVGDTSTSVGIPVFDVRVDRDSKLQQLNSTNNALKEVYIKNVDNTADADTTATGNITIKGKLVNRDNTANAQSGAGSVSTTAGTDSNGDYALPGYENQDDPYGLNDVRIVDASTMVGKVELTAVLSDAVRAKYSLNMQDTAADNTADNQAFTYTLGTNNDTLSLDVSASNLAAAGVTTREDLTVTVNAGTGNDTITTRIVDIATSQASGANTEGKLGAVTLSETLENGSNNWYVNSKQNANLSINAGEGNDTVNTFGGGDWKVAAGTGDDTVYLDNSGTKAVWAFNVQNNTTATAAVANATNKNGTTAVTATTAENTLTNLEGTALFAKQYLYGAQLTVTFSGANIDAASGVSEVSSVAQKVGFESTVTIPTTGYQGTQAQINAAIKDAINNNAVLSKLLVANDGPANTLVVTSKIDGGMAATDLRVDISAADASKMTTTDQSALMTATKTTTVAALQTVLDSAVSFAQDTSGAGYYTGAGHAVVTAATPYNNIDTLNNVNTVTTTSTIAVDAGSAMFATSTATATAPSVALNGTSSTKAADNKVTLGFGNDVLVLGTGDYSNDVVVYGADTLDQDAGKDTVVNMTVAAINEVVQGTRIASDVFDFTAYGVTSAAKVTGVITEAADFSSVTVNGGTATTNGYVHAAAGTASTAPVTGITTFDNAAVTLGDDEIAIIRFTGNATQTFAGLTDANFLAAINTNGEVAVGQKDTYGELDSKALNAAKVSASVTETATSGSTANDIVFVENAANLGEYKVFHLQFSTSNTDGEFSSAKYLGTVDVGASFGGSLDAAYSNLTANAMGLTAVGTAATSTNNGSVADNGSGTGATGTTGTKPGTDTGTDTGTKPGTDTGTKPGTDTGTKPGTDTGGTPAATAKTIAVTSGSTNDASLVNATNNGIYTFTIANADIQPAATIANFASGDKLDFADSLLASLEFDEGTAGDGNMTLLVISDTSTVEITLTGVPAAFDVAGQTVTSFNSFFGPASLV